ncbi:glutamate-cysteine ligase family protein [Emcibacter sp.]|uniref:glutamate-cysteine ligase family protein n=1 Tax=Emcibacter sp. TaxID=1979954 RepID=UPI002AA8F94B|nr:glutamate-cysteine ligase family protein [Emcibacter sp.]
MGKNFDKVNFSEEDFHIFSGRLNDQLILLKKILEKPGFGEGEMTLGAEFEMYITKGDGEISPINKQLLDRLDKSLFQLELNQFNLEYNVTPTAAAGSPFTTLHEEMTGALQTANDAAAPFDSQLVPVGILPTLRAEHLQPQFMTDIPRFHCLSDSLHKLRGGAFGVNINGQDPLQLTSHDVTLEGANTSFQIHMRVEPHRFADTFNAIQMITPLAVALAANSPLLLGHRLWQETRIALFKQSIDSRQRNSVGWRQPSRVTFGHGWVREGLWELFAETVRLYPPIIPLVTDEDAEESFRQGKYPKLEELSLHTGTTWPWNRAVYSASAGGHTRIEMRALPAGPSLIDMTANAAFYIGTAIGLRNRINDMLPAMPFRFAEYNFYRAAQDGLEAQILWPEAGQHHPREVGITEAIHDLLPLMQEGLAEIGVTDTDSARMSAIIRDRLTSRMTGARWQLEMLEQYEKDLPRVQACQAMLRKYIEEQAGGAAVAEWSSSV